MRNSGRDFSFGESSVYSPEVGAHDFHQGDPDYKTVGLVSRLAARVSTAALALACSAKVYQGKRCRTLSLGADLRHIGDVSELAYYHLRVFQLLPRRSA